MRGPGPRAESVAEEPQTTPRLPPWCRYRPSAVHPSPVSTAAPVGGEYVVQLDLRGVASGRSTRRTTDLVWAAAARTGRAPGRAWGWRDPPGTLPQTPPSMPYFSIHRSAGPRSSVGGTEEVRGRPVREREPGAGYTRRRCTRTCPANISNVSVSGAIRSRCGSSGQPSPAGSPGHRNHPWYPHSTLCRRVVASNGRGSARCCGLVAACG